MDIGTPERYLQASWDILEGRVETRVRPTAPGLLVGAGAEIDPGAEVGPRAVVSRRLPGRGRAPRSATRSCSTAAGSARAPGQRLDPRRRASTVERRRRARRRRRRPRMRESRPDEPMIDDVLGIPDQLRDALWRIESARLEPAEAAGLMVCGMGGSAIGGDLAAAALGDRLTRPLLGDPRLRAAELGDAGVDRALLQLLGRHRGDARLLRGRRGARRPPHRRQHRRRAGRRRPRGRRAGGRPAGDLPAPRRGRLHVHRRRRGRRPGRRRAARSTPRSTPPPPSSSARREALQARAAEIAAQLEGTRRRSSTAPT